MTTCTFFGHRECSDHIEPILRETIRKLIVDEKVECFLVGDSGAFDEMVFRVLRDLENHAYNIQIFLVLSKFPKNNSEFYEKYAILPDEIEFAHPRYAIDYRNRYMIKKSDFVITYTICDFGGAAKYEALARRKHKIVINIAEIAKERKEFSE